MTKLLGLVAGAVLLAVACGGGSEDDDAAMEVTPDPIRAGQEFELRIAGEANFGIDFFLHVVEGDERQLRYRLASVNDPEPVEPASGSTQLVRPAGVEVPDGSTWSVTLFMPEDLAGEEIELCALPDPCGRFSVR